MKALVTTSDSRKSKRKKRIPNPPLEISNGVQGKGEKMAAVSFFSVGRASIINVPLVIEATTNDRNGSRSCTIP